MPLTFTTPYGHFCYTRLPFGISSVSEVYQKRMCCILEGLDGVLCLIDVVLIFRKDQAERDARLLTVLNRFWQAHITLNEKCEFSKSILKFTGHVISSNGISVDPDTLLAVLNMAPPNKTTEMCCFLDMANQLAKLSSSLADTSALLWDLLRNKKHSTTCRKLWHLQQSSLYTIRTSQQKC